MFRTETKNKILNVNLKAQRNTYITKMEKIKVTYMLLCFWITHGNYGNCRSESQITDKISEALHNVINPYRLLHAKDSHQFKRLPTSRTPSQYDVNHTKSSVEFLNTDCSVVYSPTAVDELEEDETAEFTMTFQCLPDEFEVSENLFITQHQKREKGI